ncbi:MAG: hypothetical protein PHW63_04110 [Alphaproteobacteria bacterium]|nr:hypothetical protein [Alphaproteobacteria bacterium]
MKNILAFPFQLFTAVSALLFLAVAPLPYGYYTFMRIVVCGCAGFIAYRSIEGGGKNPWSFVFAFIAIIFNPVVTIHMSKEIWMVVDAISGLFFAYLGYMAYRVQKERHIDDEVPPDRA